ncbi:MAG: COX15/CtaA family protein [Cytophagales bacterium]|nr:COX15/CtaA family protein [Cytophagales bacterium]
MAREPYKPIVWWLLCGCLLIFFMVVIGGITRLTNSGLSMTDWKLVTGAFPPVTETQWLNEFEKYQQSPEFQKINYHFSLQEFKSIFWWEYIHRLVGRVLGLVFIIPFAVFWWRKKVSKRLAPKLFLIFVLGAFQGFLGWYMVKSGLVDKPHVSHFRLAAHLLLAFITCAVVLWTALDEWYEGRKVSVRISSAQSAGLKFFAALLLVQIVYGAFVAGLRAGYVYNSFPKMGGKWIADAVFSIDPLWKNWIEGIAGVQFVHRYLAYLLMAVGIALFVSLWKRLQGPARRGVMLWGASLLVQFLLGVFTLVYKVPIVLGVAHQVVAFLLLMNSVFLMHRFWKPVRATKRVRIEASKADF